MPVGRHLCGIAFEGSRYEKWIVTLRPFVQPLYVPADSFLLTFSDDLGQWDLGPTAAEDSVLAIRRKITDRALPFLDRLATPARFVQVAPRTVERTLETAEYFACAAVAAGKEGFASDYLDHLQREGQRLLLPSIPHDRNMLQRIETLVGGFRERGIDGALSVLSGWETTTRRSLELDALPVPEGR